ncbi:MAG: AlkA N-terminal domain-containing protein, partial [Polyangiaceae bacterium]
PYLFCYGPSPREKVTWGTRERGRPGALAARAGATANPCPKMASLAGRDAVRHIRAAARNRATPPARNRAMPPARNRALCELPYRSPYDWEQMVEFLRMRVVPGVEAIDGETYVRTAREGDAKGWIRVSPARGDALLLEVSPDLVGARDAMARRVRRLFDLDADPAAIAATLGRDRRLARLIARRPGLRVPRGFDPAEIATRAILGQQVTVAAARTLAGRLARTLGDPIATPIAGLDRLWPSPAQIAETTAATLIGIPLTRARAHALSSVMTAIVEKKLVLHGKEVDVAPANGTLHATMEQAIAGMIELPGIGPWTANYIAMRGLAWSDAFPEGDLILRQALGDATPRACRALAERWRPFRAYATVHLWMNHTKE